VEARIAPDASLTMEERLALSQLQQQRLESQRSLRRSIDHPPSYFDHLGLYFYSLSPSQFAHFFSVW
jgi:hypothetical protein